VRLIGLGDEAAALVEQVHNTIRQIGKRAYGETADAKGRGVAGDDDLAGFRELRRGRLLRLGLEDNTCPGQNAEQASAFSN
jgi:hypothetical protein